MIFAQQFRCEIPTPDALKEGVLYCSTNATNAPEIWSAIGTGIGALITAVMAIFAWKAWQTAQGQLRTAERESRENAYRYERTFQLDAWFEMLASYSELDSKVLSDAETVQGLAGKLRASEQKMAMVWEFPHYPQGLAEFNTCLLSAAYAAQKDDNKTSGTIVIYRKVTGSKNRLFREFYSGKIEGPEELDAALRDIAESYTQEHPDIFTMTLGPYSPQ